MPHVNHQGLSTLASGVSFKSLAAHLLKEHSLPQLWVGINTAQLTLTWGTDSPPGLGALPSFGSLPLMEL